MISHEKMIALYSAMVKYRLLAAQAHKLREQGRLAKSLQLAPGLEATVAGLTGDLGRNDSFLATESKLASAFIGRTRWKAPFDPSVLKSTHTRNSPTSASSLADEFAAALEDADEFKKSKGDAVALVFCESRMTAGLWRTQLQHASRNNLPIVLVRLAPPSRRPHIAPGALAFGVPRIAVDANDVLAVYRVASESIARARHRRGPTLIECLQTPRAASKRSLTSDPLHAMELVLARKHILNTKLKQTIETRISRKLDKMLRRMN